ncbi:MAG TPA: NADP-dependent oxidoreductase [Polyangiaceae bacterium]|nr:NADP-dependent oxidoreductase [Polyangiaceae bacterium]
MPDVGPDDVLIEVEIAGVGSWDPFEREGGYAALLGARPRFPYVLGSEGSGVVREVGSRVQRFAPHDRVYAGAFLNPKGGFYAEYAVVPQGQVSKMPPGMDPVQAGAMSGVAATALRGLEDTLRLRSGESLLLFGASGGIGHTAVQLAKRMGARVFAVASGADGVALVEKLGADVGVNGRGAGVNEAARTFAPSGFDAALVTGSSPQTAELLPNVRDGGRVAFPTGVQPAPEARPGITVTAYNGEPDADLVARLNTWIGRGPFEVHVAETFPLEEAARAHAALDQHYLGKLALVVGGRRV